jgi:hypothetical protein
VRLPEISTPPAASGTITHYLIAFGWPAVFETGNDIPVKGSTDIYAE